MTTNNATVANFDIHVFLSLRENYSDDPTKPYWKCKGGYTVVLTGFSHPMTDGIGAAGQAAVESVRAKVECVNDMCEALIIDWEFQPVGTLTEFEKDQLRFDGKVDAPDDRIAL